MKSLRIRRFRYIFSLLLLVALLGSYDQYQYLLLRQSSFLTGWVTFVLVVVLLMFNWRKKLSFLRLGSASGWMQFHIYAGFLSGAAFFCHIQFRVPQGGLESSLAALFLIVFVSGTIGLAVTRWLPGRLASNPQKVIYERIPIYQYQLQKKVQDLVAASVAATDSSAIADFYQKKLAYFFGRPLYFWKHIFRSTRHLHRLEEEMGVQAQYLNQSEREYLKDLGKFVRQKNQLDEVYTHQTVFKYWLFVHIPLSYALLVLAVLHAISVHAFIGG